MNSPLRLFLAVALLLATPWTVSRTDGGETPPASGAPTLLILVRHAEKTVGGPDPNLSPEGRERATELARVLADIEVDALYASQFQRTRLTLLPLSERSGLNIEIDPIEAEVGVWAQAFATLVLAKHRGQTVVVAGHSNTIPALARALGATNVADLGETDYDDLFWITLVGGHVELAHLHYGAISD